MNLPLVATTFCAPGRRGISRVSKPDSAAVQILRPVQVKGKYPTSMKGDKLTYGYVGRLTQLHPEMVLAIPFFLADSSDTPICTAYMPFSQIRRHSRGYRCEPASFKSGAPAPRRESSRFFDSNGLSLLATASWSIVGTPRATAHPLTLDHMSA